MNPESWLPWSDILIYSPLGVIGAWRWGVWLWQKIISFGYRPIPARPDDPSLSLSVITPVYNENPELFQRALLSWQRNTPDEIIAVIDASDTPCIAAFEEFARIYPGAKLIVTEEPGKRPALARGILAARGDIVALVDSDTVWDEKIAPALLAPFRNPAVGGVAPRQAVLAQRTLAERLFALRLDLRYFHEFPYLMVVGDALTCLSGRTAVYRRSAVLPFLDALVYETFLGKRCISGEDKRLTSLILKQGWKVQYQENAVVRTVGMPGLPTFFRQNLRWGRNSWRTDLRMIGSGWTWFREPLFGYHLIDRAAQPFALLLGPIYLGVALSLQHYAAALILVGWWLVSRTIRIIPHLRRTPENILIMPFYIVSQYLLAILKIYAFFTLDYQSWITRWHAGRIERWGFFKLLPSRVATVFVIGGIALGITQHEYSVAQALELKREQGAVAYTDDFSSFGLGKRVQAFEQERASHRAGTYVTRLGDTPFLLARKFNLTPAQASALFAGRPQHVWIRPGIKLSIPVEYLGNSLSASLASAPITRLSILYDPLTDTITVKGKGSVVTLDTIASATAIRFRPELITETAPGEWLLRSNLYIAEGATLILDGGQVKWLKLLSTDKKYIRLRSYNGGILIRNTKITSWDEASGSPDTKYQDGRAYIIAQANGRMDVLDSEIAYLGYPRAKEIQGANPVGGVYGLSWKIPNSTIGQYLLAGNVIGSRIHDNYFGIYTFGATGMIIRGNELYDNVQYGIDPHDDSSNLLIENNYVHNNGNHGIIVSKRVVYSTIRNNRSINNRLHGIMLDRQSDYNLVENNISTGNVNGIAVYDSHHNLVRGNTFVGNRFGIRANMNSSENDFRANSIRSSEKGVYLYGGARGNLVQDNEIVSNTQGVSLKETSGNFILDSLVSGKNTIAIKSDEYARTTNFIQRIR